jgi:histone H2A
MANMEKKARKPTQSKSAKAGLLMPVARLNTVMKKAGGAKRVGGSAPVYATAVLEYLLTELLELAGNTTMKAKRKRILPEDISLAVRSDEDLSKLLRGFSCCTGDKLTNVAKALVPPPLSAPKKKAAA